MGSTPVRSLLLEVWILATRYGGPLLSSLCRGRAGASVLILVIDLYHQSFSLMLRSL